MFEFDPYISQIQGCLLSREIEVQNNSDLNQQKRLHERVVNVLKKCPTSYDTRNIFLYILLNCDLDILDHISEDPNYSHLVKTAPYLPLSLCVSLILSLDGVTFLGELLKFAPAGLTIPVMDKILEMVDHNTEFIDDNHIIELAKACLKKIALGKNESVSVLNIFLYFLKILLDFEPQKLVEVDLYEEKTNVVFGGTLLKNLEVCLCCFDDSINIQDTCWNGYLIQCVPYDATSRFFEISNNLNSHTEVMQDCKEYVLSSSVKILQKASHVGWFGWAEVNMDHSETFLQCIGQFAQRLLPLLQNQDTFSDVPPVLLEILSRFAEEPQREEDKIANASLEEFKASFADQKSHNKKWMKALLQRKDLLGNEDCLQLIQTHCLTLGSEDVSCLLDYIVSKVKADDLSLERRERLRSLSHKVLKQLPFESVKSIHKDYFEKHGLNSDLCSHKFPVLFLETFNKISFGSKQYCEEWCCDLLRLSLQNPSAVARKMIEVGLEDTSLAAVMSTALALMTPVSEEILRNWLVELSHLCFFNKSQMDGFPTFAKELLRQDLLPTTTFLSVYAIPSIHLAVDSHKWAIASMWLSTLKHVLTDEGVCPQKVCHIAALLGYLGQVIELCEQPIKHFTLSCVQVRQNAIEIIQSLRPVYIDDVDKNWLQNYVGELSLFTQSHFRSFIHEDHSNTCSLYFAPRAFTFNHMFKGKVISPQVAACVLIEIIPSLTVHEWRSLADTLKERFDNFDDSCLVTFQAFQQAIYVLAAALSQTDLSENKISCLNHCVCCFGTIIKLNVLPALKPSNFLKVIEETMQLMSKLPSEVWDRGGMSILPVLVNLMEEITPELLVSNSLSALVDACPSNQTCALLRNFFLKMSQNIHTNCD